MMYSMEMHNIRVNDGKIQLSRRLDNQMVHYICCFLIRTLVH